MRKANSVFIALLGGMLVVAGCKHAPPAPPPRIPLMAHVVVAAASDVNPDPTGRASPVVIRVYRLRSGDTFKGAAMEPLYFKDREVLAADLVERDQCQLFPGQSCDLQWELSPDVHVLGVMAALRDYTSVPWRVFMAVPPSPTKKGPHVLALTRKPAAPDSYSMQPAV